RAKRPPRVKCVCMRDNTDPRADVDWQIPRVPLSPNRGLAAVAACAASFSSSTAVDPASDLMEDYCHSICPGMATCRGSSCRIITRLPSGSTRLQGIAVLVTIGGVEWLKRASWRGAEGETCHGRQDWVVPLRGCRIRDYGTAQTGDCMPLSSMS